MRFKSREELQGYYRYLKYRDFCKKMYIWLLVPLFMLCMCSTVFTFMSLDMFRYDHTDCLQLERFTYTIWCVFAVILIKGTVRYNRLNGGCKYALIFGLSLAVTFLIVNINVFIRFEPYSIESYTDSLVSDLSYNVGYGLLRYPAVYFAVSRCSVVLCSEKYLRISKSLSKYLSRFRWRRFEKKMIDLFSVTDEYDDQEV